jgi:hypothetical protein
VLGKRRFSSTPPRQQKEHGEQRKRCQALSQIERQNGNAEGKCFQHGGKRHPTVTHSLVYQQQLYLSGERDADEAEVVLGIGDGSRLIMRQPGLVKYIGSNVAKPQAVAIRRVWRANFMIDPLRAGELARKARRLTPWVHRHTYCIFTVMPPSTTIC